MKKPKTYNLEQDVYEAINKLAKDDGRSDSDWLNIHLGNTLPAKEVSKPKTELVQLEPKYPENLNVDAWKAWLDFRKVAKFKKYKSDAPMKKLAKMGNQIDQMEIVHQSIDNEYQGLFALKGNNNGQSQKSSQKLSAYDRARAENDEYRQPNEREVGMGTASRDLGRTVDEGAGGKALIELDKGTFVDY